MFNNHHHFLNKFLGLFVPEDMSKADICKAADILESLNCSSRLIVCRQKKPI